jgi:hypothetical protein
VPDSAEHLNLEANPRMERIVDANQLYALFAGSMWLLRLVWAKATSVAASATR